MCQYVEPAIFRGNPAGGSKVSSGRGMELWRGTKGHRGSKNYYLQLQQVIRIKEKPPLSTTDQPEDGSNIFLSDTQVFAIERQKVSRKKR